MADSTPFVPSRLLQSLPAMYHGDPFLGQFLIAFEKVLLGLQDDVTSPSVMISAMCASTSTPKRIHCIAPYALPPSPLARTFSFAPL